MANQKATQLAPFAIIPTQAVSSGTVTSLVTDMFTKDNATLQFIWTGTLAGTFDVQASLDYSPDTKVGDWNSLGIGSSAAASGTPDSGIIEINQFGPRYIRVVFSWSSGSGNLTGYVMGKAI